jgi:hypothetical protein
VNDHDQLVAKADEYSKRAARVGDPQMRPAIEAYTKVAYLKGIKDGIEYAKAEAKAVANG